MADPKGADWQVVMTRTATVGNQLMGEMMTAAETSSASLLLAVMIAGEKQQSNQLYYILLLMCGQQQLTEVMNRGMVAWRRLVDMYGLATKSSRGTDAPHFELELSG